MKLIAIFFSALFTLSCCAMELETIDRVTFMSDDKVMMRMDKKLWNMSSILQEKLRMRPVPIVERSAQELSQLISWLTHLHENNFTFLASLDIDQLLNIAQESLYWDLPLLFNQALQKIAEKLYDNKEIDKFARDIPTYINHHRIPDSIQLLLSKLIVYYNPLRIELLKKIELESQECGPQISSYMKFHIPSGDGQLLAVGGTNSLYLYDTPDSDTAPIFLGNFYNSVGSVQFNAEGTVLAASMGDTIRVWTIPNEEPRYLHGHDSFITAVKFSPNAEFFASSAWPMGSHLSVIYIWQNYGLYKKIEFPGYVEDIAWNSDGTLLACVTREGDVHIWETVHWDRIQIFKLAGEYHKGRIVFSHDGHVLAVALYKYTAQNELPFMNVHYWDTKNWSMQSINRIFTLYEDRLKSFRFSPDNHFMILSSDCSIYLYDIYTQKEIRRFWLGLNGASIGGVSFWKNKITYIKNFSMPSKDISANMKMVDIDCLSTVAEDFHNLSLEQALLLVVLHAKGSCFVEKNKQLRDIFELYPESLKHEIRHYFNNSSLTSMKAAFKRMTPFKALLKPLPLGAIAGLVASRYFNSLRSLILDQCSFTNC